MDKFKVDQDLLAQLVLEGQIEQLTNPKALSKA